MNEVKDFLKSCGTFYLATVDEKGEPRVRPFGAVTIFDGKLYIVTNNKKDVWNQMMANSKIEICGMSKGKWIRVHADAIHDSRREARVAMMDENSASLQMYTVDDNLMEVLYLENATATIYSFTEEPKVINF